jgi:uncharacterized membrane protein
MKRIGRLFFAMALAAFGVQQFLFGDFIPGRAPAFPDGIPGKLAWAYISGAILILCAFAIAGELKGRIAAIAVAVMICGWALVRHIPLVAAAPNGVTITFAGKALALFGGALAVAASFGGKTKSDAAMLWAGRVCLGAFLIIGGVEHFIYPQFVSTLVPSWIPGALFWTYFAAIALIAGGIGMLVPRTARLAAFLSGLMIFLWVILLHIPRAIRAVDEASSRNEWTAVFEALASPGSPSSSRLW